MFSSDSALFSARCIFNRLAFGKVRKRSIIFDWKAENPASVGVMPNPSLMVTRSWRTL